MISYEPLWDTLKEKNMSKNALVVKHGISKYTLVRMARNMPTNSTTIDDLCRILNCDIIDIMKYTPTKESQN